MNLTLKRDVFADKFTLGSLMVNGKHLGFTCEDKDRKLEEGNEKVYGQTAIPRGKYKVIISFSHRFKKPMPEVLSVPGFSGIRIHGGNTDADTLGCPLLGVNRTGTGVANCAGVNTRLISLIEDCEEIGEEVWLTVE
jgi:hypothetical protein